MSNPYHVRSPYSFWRQAVAACSEGDIDPVVATQFKIRRSDAVATAGSCFAQHISRTLVESGFNYLVTEKADQNGGEGDDNYGVFPARFGNIYTSRQLVQLFDRAYGLRRPTVDWWRDKHGNIIDPFRPRIQASGFPTVDEMRADRKRHLAAVRAMFEQCSVFIFTLGLTETWISTLDGSAFPLAPGVVAPDVPDSDCAFYNESVADITSEIADFLDKLRTVNPTANVILTVSPVALIATYEDRHVLISNIASKSILRAAADAVCRVSPSVSYFPSYEIITGPQARGKYFAADLREVTPEGVARVMRVFKAHYLEPGDTGTLATPAHTGSQRAQAPEIPQVMSADVATDKSVIARMSDLAAVICDEEAIVE